MVGAEGREAGTNTVGFTSLPWPYRLLCTPVIGRRVGRTQMEESKMLGCGSLNVYEQIQKNTME